MKALRIELGLSAHLLDATGGVFGTEEEQWQCVRVQRAFAGLDLWMSQFLWMGSWAYEITMPPSYRDRAWIRRGSR